MVTINKQFAFGANEGSSQKTQSLYIILHEVGVDNSSAQANAAYFKNNWSTAETYSTFVVGADGIYQVGEPGYVAWAALNANPYAPVQIELCNTDNQDEFKRSYANYIELIRHYAEVYGIPLTLDAGGAGTPGIKTHAWVTANYNGDHTDPYGYLASHGISKDQLARDIANGISRTVTTAPVTQSTPAATQASSGTWTDDDGSVVTLERGVFKPNQQLRDWYYPGYKPTGGIWNAGDSIHYKGYVTNGAFVYVAYDGYGQDAGRTCYVACRDANTREPLGTFE